MILCCGLAYVVVESMLPLSLCCRKKWSGIASCDLVMMSKVFAS